MESPPPALDDCLKLLRGSRDEQKLAGLLLAAKLCPGSSTASVRAVYDAVGTRFLTRLLMTGMGKVSAGVSGGEDREAYLKLGVTVLAAFCRVPEIASSEEMVSKIGLVVEIIANSSDPSLIQECYELLLLVALASEKGIAGFYELGVLEMLAPNISTLQDGSQALELAMRVLQTVLKKLPVPLTNNTYLSGVSCMVASVARQFAVLHNALKFDALHLLTSLLSSANIPLYDALRSVSGESWAAYIRVGIAEVLQNRVVSREKLQALLLVECVMSIRGEEWLLEQNNLNDVQESLPVDKYLLLVLESSRVEVAILLNEIAYLKYEASKSSTSPEAILLKQHDLSVTFSLIEKIIKLIAKDSAEGNHISESILMKVVAGLNETIHLVLDFLQDSKDHGQKRGNDLLAAVRVIGSYLAETPYACKGRSPDLLEYMLSIEGEDESSPFYSVCFLLPMLCQITMESDGCKALVSFGGHRAIAECLVKLIRQNDPKVENSGAIFLACDTILNILLNGKELRAHQDGSHFVNLLQALAFWVGSSNDPSNVMMASSICALVFDFTSEDSLLKHDNLDYSSLESLSHIIARSLNQRTGDSEEHSDLHEIIAAGYDRWVDRFPTVQNAVESSEIQSHFR